MENINEKKGTPKCSGCIQVCQMEKEKKEKETKIFPPHISILISQIDLEKAWNSHAWTS